MSFNWKDRKFPALCAFALLYPAGFGALYCFLKLQFRAALPGMPPLRDGLDDAALLLVFLPVLVSFWWLPYEGKRRPLAIGALSLAYLACLAWPWRYFLLIISMSNGESP